MLVAALQWLLTVCDSRLFHRFWAEAAARARADSEDLSEPESEPNGSTEADAAMLLPAREASSVDHEEAALEEEEWLCRAMRSARRMWLAVYHGLVTKCARLDDLCEHVEVLLNARELNALEASAAGLLRHADADATDGADGAALEAADAWALVSLDPEWQDEMGAQLSHLAHVCAVRAVLPRVQKCLLLFEVWVEPVADESISLATVRETATALAAVLEERWDAATLETLGDFDKLANTIDPRLLLFEDELFSVTQGSNALVQWYRLTPDEQNFTTSVEMAMGRSQMECPDALWNHAQRCVDEGKLSMLSSARAYLHEHLFGSGEGDVRLESITAALDEDAPSKPPPHERYTYATLLDVFSRLDWRKAKEVVTALRACGPLVGSFIGLMGNDADAAAPHRLAAMQGRQMRARFWCSSEPPMMPASRQGSGGSEEESSVVATEVTTTATAEDGMMLAPARIASHATQNSADSGRKVYEAATVEANATRQAFVWLEYSVIRHGRRLAHVLPLSECAPEIRTLMPTAAFGLSLLRVPSSLACSPQDSRLPDNSCSRYIARATGGHDGSD